MIRPGLVLSCWLGGEREGQGQGQGQASPTLVEILAKVPKYKDWWDVKILKDQTFCQLKLPASLRGSLWKIARQGAYNPETEMQVQSDHGKSDIEEEKEEKEEEEKEEEEEEEEDWAWTRGCTRKHRRIHYDEEDEAKKKSGDALRGWPFVECSGCGEQRSEYLKIDGTSKAGGQDWECMGGRILCQSCYIVFFMKGSLEEVHRREEASRVDETGAIIVEKPGDVREETMPALKKRHADVMAAEEKEREEEGEREVDRSSSSSNNNNNNSNQHHVHSHTTSSSNFRELGLGLRGPLGCSIQHEQDMRHPVAPNSDPGLQIVKPTGSNDHAIEGCEHMGKQKSVQRSTGGIGKILHDTSVSLLYDNPVSLCRQNDGLHGEDRTFVGQLPSDGNDDLNMYNSPPTQRQGEMNKRMDMRTGRQGEIDKQCSDVIQQLNTSICQQGVVNKKLGMSVDRSGEGAMVGSKRGRIKVRMTPPAAKKHESMGSAAGTDSRAGRRTAAEEAGLRAGRARGSLLDVFGWMAASSTAHINSAGPGQAGAQRAGISCSQHERTSDERPRNREKLKLKRRNPIMAEERHGSDRVISDEVQQVELVLMERLRNNEVSSSAATHEGMIEERQGRDEAQSDALRGRQCKACDVTKDMCDRSVCKGSVTSEPPQRAVSHGCSSSTSREEVDELKARVALLESMLMSTEKQEGRQQGERSVKVARSSLTPPPPPPPPPPPTMRVNYKELIPVEEWRRRNAKLTVEETSRRDKVINLLRRRNRMTMEEWQIDKMSKEEEIISAIGEGSLTEFDIMRKLGDSRYAREVVRRLLDQGVLQRVGKGVPSDVFKYSVRLDMVDEDGKGIRYEGVPDRYLEARMRRYEMKIMAAFEVAQGSTMTETAIRDVVGNSASTGKALRRMVASTQILRIGMGGPTDPYHYKVNEAFVSPPSDDEDSASPPSPPASRERRRPASGGRSSANSRIEAEMPESLQGASCADARDLGKRDADDYPPTSCSSPGPPLGVGDLAARARISHFSHDVEPLCDSENSLELWEL